MSTQSFSTAPSCSSAAYFRDWGKKLSDALTAVGFTKTADTGQIDWTSVAAPSTTDQMMGYEIRAFSDATQSSNPVIVKIEYGSGISSASNCAIHITLGRATDGAGNFVGTTTAVMVMRNSTNSTSASDCYVSGASDRVNFAMFSNTSYIFMFTLERTKNANGSNNSNGVNAVWVYSGANYQQYFPKKGQGFPVSPASAGICCLCPYTGTASYGGNIGLFPILPYIGYADNPDLGACVYFTADISAATDISLTILGSSHTYKTMGNAIGTVNSNSSSKSLALRYE
ncbi:MAG: hypothetical protein WC479_06970 [Candidatus Izemoplasmatales bacterium]